ncbi:BMP family protein [Borrelia coriaceae]|uniref:Nucleoside-binding protein n=1 Tax=Borrelia coriaceae ATCC 43381 TaxID=1408429 RepID=W5SUF3_9SPIR|nr:BMP family protein [Borrelia coriaceae]AHH10555.1 Nucleoside-binding protein [Borrelia coriaceae ATCC 43381]UPA16245.1 BMP family protein [Borrelia coriaceae]
MNNRFIVFICVVLAFLGCDKKSLTSKSLQRPIISLIFDGTFGNDASNGTKMLEEDFEVEIVEKLSTSVAYASDLEALKDKGSSIVWGIGFSLQEAIEQAATLNKDINYGAIDIAYKDHVNFPDNLLGISFKVEEAAFLAGYLAAKTSKTGKIGFLGGIEGIVFDAFRYGYEAGAKYANKDIELNSQYVGTFSDLSLARTVALRMYKDGSDVIFVAAGLACLGAIEVAKELGAGHYIIGVDQDQSYLAPDNVLTSVINSVGNSIYEITKHYLKTNSFDGGKVLKLGIKDGSVSIIKHDSKIKDDIRVELEDIEDKIRGGVITVPRNLDEYNRFLDIYSLLN